MPIMNTRNHYLLSSMRTRLCILLATLVVSILNTNYCCMDPGAPPRASEPGAAPPAPPPTGIASGVYDWGVQAAPAQQRTLPRSQPPNGRHPRPTLYNIRSRILAVANPPGARHRWERQAQPHIAIAAAAYLSLAAIANR